MVNRHLSCKATELQIKLTLTSPLPHVFLFRNDGFLCLWPIHQQTLRLSAFENVRNLDASHTYPDFLAEMSLCYSGSAAPWLASLGLLCY